MPSFEKKIKVIDKNIKQLESNTLNLKDSMLLLKSTTNLLSSAKDLILSQHNTINDDSNEFLITNNLDEYYNQLLIRQKKITDLTNKYKSSLESQKKLININEESYDEDNEKNSLLNKDNNPIEVGFVIDKNEALMKKNNKDLEEICNDMTLAKKNISEQGKNINEIGELADISEKRTKSGKNVINEYIDEKNCGRIMLIIVNILLFVLILGIIFAKLI